MSPSRFGRPAILAAAAAVLLSGCADTTFGGVAAQVGDEQISMSQVDGAADALCQAEEQTLRDNGQVVPMRQVRRLVASLLVDAATARQVAEEYDVTPGPEVESEAARVESTTPDLTDEQRQDFVDAATAQLLKQSVASVAGEAALSEEGVTDPTPEEAAARGAEIFAAWSAEHDVDLDPRFGLAVTDGQFQIADTDLSVPVSDLATAAADDADTEHPKSLPESQRCG
ncbi:hypothetical protein [Nocardioides houyundeii]|uniref:hypothetical protein n=1 Tax=Nocardioides houyundeii TaxID=2045452 RepID=UPI000DF38C89|nr:hypothetical protein [Nocardioides houyundeii]